MNLSSRSVQILKNFATINNGLVVKKGSVLRTISPQKTILATATLGETFDREFGIYDLSQFLGAVSLIGDTASLLLGEKHVDIVASGASKGIKYFYSEPSLITTAPEKEITLPAEVASFDITWAALSELIKACSILSLPEIVVEADADGNIRIGAVDSKNTTSNSLFIDILTAKAKSKFQVIFKAENIKLLAGDYRLTVSRGLSVFECPDIKYYIATEASSKYD